MPRKCGREGNTNWRALNINPSIEGRSLTETLYVSDVEHKSGITSTNESKSNQHTLKDSVKLTYLTE